MIDTGKDSSEHILNSIITNNCIPDDPELFDSFIGGDGVFELEEGVMLDFKDKFPFSNSDQYFGGILRLICAFYNCYGGIILFGIHDSERTAGHNSVNINIERFNSVLIRSFQEKLPATINSSKHLLESWTSS